MLDLRQYPSLGAALRDALEHWPNETCLIEADRDKEKTRLTYSDFKELARPLTRAQDADTAGVIARPSSRQPIKWLVSAYAIFFVAACWFPSTSS
jgi:acyl-CoA synthetase (AMP-forming)/AMP-acid ligase II